MPHERATLKNLRLLVVESEDGFVPKYVTLLGGRAERYCRALMTLAARREFEAQEALRIFKKAARDVSQMSIPSKSLSDAPLADHELNIRHTEIERQGAALIDIRPHKRWELDRFGMLALQILLWIWYARTHPGPCEAATLTVAKLPDFHNGPYKFERNPYNSHKKSNTVYTKSCEEWWKSGITLYNRARRSQEFEWRLHADISLCCRASAAKRHTYILRVLRDRFHSFAPEPH